MRGRRFLPSAAVFADGSFSCFHVLTYIYASCLLELKVLQNHTTSSKMTNWKVLSLVALSIGIVGLVAVTLVFALGQGYQPQDVSCRCFALIAFAHSSVFLTLQQFSMASLLTQVPLIHGSHFTSGRQIKITIRGSLRSCTIARRSLELVA